MEPLLLTRVYDRQARRLQQAHGRSGSGSGSGSGFEREYAEICWSIDKAPWFKAALTPQTRETRAKNRYCDVLPFEKTRVKLLGCDYINANHIDDEYIACCAPVPAAIVDFWHMVWQCRVHVILMLTNFVERERPKAHVYWDMRGQAVDFGGVHVQLIDETGHEQQQAVDGFITRMFRAWTTDKHGRELESRVIKHLQLTVWPDHGVLRDFRVIAPLLESMNAFRAEASRSSGVDTRVIVHCSAGIGRSGTFIAIDILLKQIQQAIAASANGAADEEAVWMQALDVARVVHRIRSQRPGMVQTPVCKLRDWWSSLG